MKLVLVFLRKSKKKEGEELLKMIPNPYHLPPSTNHRRQWIQKEGILARHSRRRDTRQDARPNAQPFILFIIHGHAMWGRMTK